MVPAATALQAAATPPAPAPDSVAAPATGAGNTATSALPANPLDTHTKGCLPSGDGYLRARIRGALNLDIDWHDADIECDGGARPSGNGIRVSFAGPLKSDGRRLRMVFGVGDVKEGVAGKELPTNLTVIFEGENRLFTTQGQDRCTVDQLEQQRVGALGGSRRTYRIVARGFCVAPASALDGAGQILVSRFDFAGDAVFEDETP